jgi:Acyltransferase
MLNVLNERAMPAFWPPRPHPFWTVLLEPLRRWYLRRWMRVAEVVVEGLDELRQRVTPGDGLLLAPNHSDHADPQVLLEVGRRWGRQFYFMAAWQSFYRHWRLDGFLMQRLGAFSVDREGSDRRAVRKAVELLTTGQALVVFPEGEIYYLNDRLTPLLEGVAFMALMAQRELEKSKPAARVWLAPAAIRFRYVEDVSRPMETLLARMEQRFLLKPPAGAALHERVLRLGEMLLTLKEKEKLGQSREGEGDLAARLRFFIETLLQRLERDWLAKSPAAETVPLRIKAVRRSALEAYTSETADAAGRTRAAAALDDLHLTAQLYSYPGDYLLEKVCPERVAETLLKFDEDMTGNMPRPIGRRRARVVLGEPIDLKARLGSGRSRTLAGDVTDELEDRIRQLMTREA